MTPQQLSEYLAALMEHSLHHAVMIWGVPGIGKSSVVRQVADARGIGFVDIRLSQLAPTDLRGIPAPRDGVAHWFPPEFLPTSGEGVLFLDEINLAPPVMQGVAQQLVLDRRVGSYEVPSGWFVWAAGNRKEDRAAIFDMPAPLANRFLHLQVEAHLESFRQYAYRRKFDPLIIGFLNFRPSLLHKMDQKHEAWPSPRSWEMADGLLEAGLDLTPAIGPGATAEFNVYRQAAEMIPNIERILKGTSKDTFPTEPSLQYALTSGLVARIGALDEAMNAMRWLAKTAPPEWVQMAASEMFPKLRDLKLFDRFRKVALGDDEFTEFLTMFSDLAA